MAETVGEKDICLKCGKCCRLMQSLKSHEELEELSKRGDKAAINFLKLFIPYESLEDAIRIDPVVVDEILEMNKHKYGIRTKTYFYYCKYINDDNTCKVYNIRPKLCREYPKFAFTILPENCAYEGYIFEVREKIKEQVRKIKEKLADIAVIKQNSVNPNELRKCSDLEEKYTKMIEKFSVYGAKDW